jgi:hypothetical protein
VAAVNSENRITNAVISRLAGPSIPGHTCGNARDLFFQFGKNPTAFPVRGAGQLARGNRVSCAAHLPTLRLQPQKSFDNGQAVAGNRFQGGVR